MRTERKIFLVITIILICVLTYNQFFRVKKFSHSFFAMDTYVGITVYAKNRNKVEKFFNEAEKFCEEFDDSLSIVKDNGLQKFNRGDIPFLVMGKFVKPVIIDAVKMNILTSGYFDPTVGVFLEEWNYFSDSTINIPTEKRLNHLKKYVGINHIRIKGDTLFKDSDSVMIDVGGIAKGFAVDYMIDMMKKYGIKSGLINAGGDIRCLGTKPGNKPFIIGVQDPRVSNHLIFALSVKNASVVTSGDYERYFIRDSVRYHHIIDPSTGMPSHNSVSVTILGPSAEMNDALATAVFVMGPNKGIKFIEELEGVEGIIVYEENGKLYYKASSGLKKQLSKSLGIEER